MKALWIIVGVIIAVVLIWGFVTRWGKGTSSSSPTQAANQTTNSISIKNFSFSPSSTTVVKGTTVTWTNNDSTAHTITADNGKFESGDVAPGKTFQFTFNETGTFSYHCSIHTTMKGTVNVQ